MYKRQDILDVNVGLPEIDEVKIIQQATEQLQGSTLRPLQIDSTDPAADVYKRQGQELEEHYFGAIRPTVSAYMKDLDDELWALGIPAKTKHNEVAPRCV